MKYDIEADWLILTTCNFSCEYCFLSEEQLKVKVQVYGTPEKWKNGFDSTGKTWLIHITGGEPLLYPRFADLCNRLTETHYISLNTNLSRGIDEFVKCVDPQRVSFVHASIHPKQRSLEEFNYRLSALQEYGFRVFVSAVMEPYIIQNFENIIEELKPSGLFPIPKVMRGRFRGRRFPASYLEEERQEIFKWLSIARDYYRRELEDEIPTINVLEDAYYLQPSDKFKGKMCASGSRFVRVNANGDVQRCRSLPPLGNILKGNVTLLSEPKLCDTSFCPYFCRKYTLPEFTAC